MANETPAKRQIAYKVTIGDINEGRYVKEEGWEPNYVVVRDGRKISRLNIVAIVVSKTVEEGFQALVLDDGTGKINVRSFGSEINFENFNIGDLVLIVGRPREFNELKYIVPEIIKSFENKKWIEVRKLELQIVRKNATGIIFDKDDSLTSRSGSGSSVKKGFEEEVVGNYDIQDSVDKPVADQDNPYQKILSMIKSMDKGDGVDLQEVCIKSRISEAEAIIMDLLKDGEVYEIRPGRIKILS